MATCVQLAAVSHATSRSSSRVLVTERLHLLAALRTVARRAETRRHARLVHVHRRPPFLRRAMRRSPQGRSYACCPAGGTQQSGVPDSAWVPIDDGLSGTNLQPTSTPALHTASVPWGIFMRRG